MVYKRGRVISGMLSNSYIIGIIKRKVDSYSQVINSHLSTILVVRVQCLFLAF
jgi:hypothetical protein